MKNKDNVIKYGKRNVIIKRSTCSDSDIIWSSWYIYHLEVHNDDDDDSTPSHLVNNSQVR